MIRIDMRFPQGRDKCLTLSYDDGVEQDARMIELMNRYGIAGTFNINSGKYGFQAPFANRMTLEQCREVYLNNPLVEIATHSVSHPHIGAIPTAQAMSEIVNDRANIERDFGTLCRGHAYPYGSFTPEVKEILRLSGIAYARTTKSTQSFDLPTDWLELPATCHHKHPRFMELTERFLAEEVTRAPYLFYLWGHTYEFDKDDSWYIIEEFFQTVGRRENIWYATNIQVYDYVKAYEQLIYSADGNRVCNPTATDVWVKAGKTVYKIPSGESVDFINV